MSPDPESIKEAVNQTAIHHSKLQVLWVFLITGLTSLWAVLTKRVIDIPRDYVLKNDIKDFVKEVKEEDRRLYEKIESAVEKLHTKVDSIKDELLNTKGR